MIIVAAGPGFAKAEKVADILVPLTVATTATGPSVDPRVRILLVRPAVVVLVALASDADPSVTAQLIEVW
jgi:hypothetical protein